MLNLLILICLIFYVINLILKNDKNSFYFKLNPNMKIKKVYSDIYVIDDFYMYPNLIRTHFIRKKFSIHNSIYDTKYFNPKLNNCKFLINFFEKLCTTKINLKNWSHHCNNNSNGYLQYITKGGQPCIHTDDNTNYGGVVYLGDNDHYKNGTSFYQHKNTGLKEILSDEQYDKLSKDQQKIFMSYHNNDLWKQGEKPQFDKWNKYYTCDNKFNRIVIFNSKRFHCAEPGYGNHKYDSRFFQTFFF